MFNFPINRCPDVSGCQPTQYVEQTELITERLTGRFHRGITDKEDLGSLFYQALHEIAAIRKRIAIEHKIESPSFFAERRDAPKLQHIVSITPLNGPYIYYGELILDLCVEDLRSIICAETGEFESSSMTFVLEQGSIQYNIYTPGNSQNWLFQGSREDYHRFCQICGVDDSRADYHQNGFKRFITDRTLLDRLKERSPWDFEKIVITGAIKSLTKELNVKAKAWVVISKYSMEDEKNVSLTKYITWVPYNCGRDPAGALLHEATVSLIHSDSLGVGSSLQAIGQIFQEALKCNSESIEEIKTYVAKFNYRLADTMPFLRDTALLAGIFEKAIYKFHGYELNEMSHYSPHLDALISLQDDFITEYTNAITLTRFHP